jgi:tetratricopeptide (TPR) repeat protein
VLIGTKRLKQGREKMAEGLEVAKQHRAFVTASRTARHLAFIAALQGDRAKSLELADESVSLLDQRRAFFIWLLDLPFVTMAHQRMSAHANLGCMRHYFGELEEAQRQFEQAERIQAGATRYPKLRAIWGYRYADLLLDLGRYDEAEQRLLSALVNPHEPKGWGEGVFAEPLLWLGFVRLRIRQADLLGRRDDWEQVVTFKEKFKDFGDPVKPAEDAEPEPRRRRFWFTEKKKKEEYKLRLDVLVPAFRSAVAGVARLSGELANAAKEIDRAEMEAREMKITLFDNEIRVERARILLAQNRHAEALAELRRDEQGTEVVPYRRAELERLRAELAARDSAA